MRRYLPAIAVAAVLMSGAVHGFWTGRWGLTESVREAAARAETAALDLPSWHGVALDTKSSADSHAVRHLFRRYAHRESGQEVAVLLVCGKPGPVSIHTPDACYGASGYQVSAPVKQPCSVGDDKVEFWCARMLKKRATEQLHVRVLWAWNAGQGWVASDSPRTAFAHRGLLYKLYLVRDLPRGDEARQEDASVALMRELLPALDRSLFSQS